ncbi:hypothetical protein BJ085DRAFT_32438 [Dimargaris cristalligena]|uniref:Uncharacterized protein n=1 Tax=Dimargaris cristalligena TaxID=215637 RepID=A0A4P9ZYL9_9FUNG|nr:hypothetical protein BJ085DRAFT_32438 [Dimargaris cristalligena]|eukprot:RKP38767.1 hypothetical protein BJ085DRAFT_32438 [Dimargaris cristalligena]
MNIDNVASYTSPPAVEGGSSQLPPSQPPPSTLEPLSLSMSPSATLAAEALANLSPPKISLALGAGQTPPSATQLRPASPGSAAPLQRLPSLLSPVDISRHCRSQTPPPVNHLSSLPPLRLHSKPPPIEKEDAASHISTTRTGEHPHRNHLLSSSSDPPPSRDTQASTLGREPAASQGPGGSHSNHSTLPTNSVRHNQSVYDSMSRKRGSNNNVWSDDDAKVLLDRILHNLDEYHRANKTTYYRDMAHLVFESRYTEAQVKNKITSLKKGYHLALDQIATYQSRNPSDNPAVQAQEISKIKQHNSRFFAEIDEIFGPSRKDRPLSTTHVPSAIYTEAEESESRRRGGGPSSLNTSPVVANQAFVHRSHIHPPPQSRFHPYQSPEVRNLSHSVVSGSHHRPHSVSPIVVPRYASGGRHTAASQPSGSYPGPYAPPASSTTIGTGSHPSAQALGGHSTGYDRTYGPTGSDYHHHPVPSFADRSSHPENPDLALPLQNLLHGSRRLLTDFSKLLEVYGGSLRFDTTGSTSHSSTTSLLPELTEFLRNLDHILDLRSHLESDRPEYRAMRPSQGGQVSGYEEHGCLPKMTSQNGWEPYPPAQLLSPPPHQPARLPIPHEATSSAPNSLFANRPRSSSSAGQGLSMGNGPPAVSHFSNPPSSTPTASTRVPAKYHQNQHQLHYSYPPDPAYSSGGDSQPKTARHAHSHSYQPNSGESHPSFPDEEDMGKTSQHAFSTAAVGTLAYGGVSPSFQPRMGESSHLSAMESPGPLSSRPARHSPLVSANYLRRTEATSPYSNPLPPPPLPQPITTSPYSSMPGNSMPRLRHMVLPHDRSDSPTYSRRDSENRSNTTLSRTHASPHNPPR